MIFWQGGKIFSLIRDAAVIECAYFDYSPELITFLSTVGVGFVRIIAIKHRSDLVFYNRVGSFGNRKRLKLKRLYSIPIVSEFAEEFPERFAIKTKNIDLLRELIAQGKKVSWLDVDIYTEAHFLGILNFEHVFIDPYINTHVVFPTGEVVTLKEGVKFNTYGYCIKYSKLIGFNRKDIHNRIDWKAYNKSRWFKGKSYTTTGYVVPQLAANLYNIFSITYLIWRQSKLNAMSAKKRIAQKD